MKLHYHISSLFNKDYNYNNNNDSLAILNESFRDRKAEVYAIPAEYKLDDSDLGVSVEIARGHNLVNNDNDDDSIRSMNMNNDQNENIFNDSEIINGNIL